MWLPCRAPGPSFGQRALQGQVEALVSVCPSERPKELSPRASHLPGELIRLHSFLRRGEHNTPKATTTRPARRRRAQH